MARKDARQPVNRPATIVVGKTRLPCKIANVSRTGAMLLIANAEWLPKRFEVEDTFSGVCRQATLAWIDSKRIGVRFAKAAELAPQQHASPFGRRRA